MTPQAARRALLAHAATPPTARLAVAAAVDVAGDELRLEFELRGAGGAIALPKRSIASERRDRLWEHTCCEVFLAAREAEAYVEVNLSPSGDWAVWAFDAYREGMRPLALARALEVAVRRAPAPGVQAATGAAGGVSTLDVDLARLATSLPLAEIAAHLGGPPALAGLAAVIEEVGGAKSYWASAHAADRPDFHRRAGWTIPVFPSRTRLEGRAR